MKRESVHVYEVRLVKTRVLKVRETVDCYEKARVILHAMVGTADREHMVVLFLNNLNLVIGSQVVAIGGYNACGVTPAQVLRGALMAGAAAVIVGHNHPSGIPSPSGDDHTMTQNLKAACEIVGVHLLDHVIVTADPQKSYSFAGSGSL